MGFSKQIIPCHCGSRGSLPTSITAVAIQEATGKFQVEQSLEIIISPKSYSFSCKLYLSSLVATEMYVGIANIFHLTETEENHFIQIKQRHV